MDEPNATQISNVFIDCMMKGLSGEAVKVYIAVVRKMQDLHRDDAPASFKEIVNVVCPDDEYTDIGLGASFGELILNGLLGVALAEEDELPF